MDTHPLVLWTVWGSGESMAADSCLGTSGLKRIHSNHLSPCLSMKVRISPNLSSLEETHIGWMIEEMANESVFYLSHFSQVT